MDAVGQAFQVLESLTYNCPVRSAGRNRTRAKPMHIAQIAPLFESVPPLLYGGTERVVSYLTEELVRQGHDVTLFASGDSRTSARLVPACARALWRDPDYRETLPHHVRLMELVFREYDRFDVLHFHCDFLHFPILRRRPCPNVTTLHGLMHPPDLEPLLREFDEMPLVSVSVSQRSPLPWANWQATVYHGLPSDLFSYQEHPGDYLAFLGRISPDKGVEQAIAIALEAGKRLKIAAKIYPEDQEYYHAAIVPRLNQAKSRVEFVGEVGGPAKQSFLGQAEAVLFPIGWPEPFGLVMIEAMACGTPVVAFRRGSVSEVMTDGTTGFVVDDVAGAVAALKRIHEIDRKACRTAFEQRFDAARMVRDYLDVYARVIAAHLRG
jgi:glycosyltransferase involved in cell wall biosynthesis